MRARVGGGRDGSHRRIGGSDFAVGTNQPIPQPNNTRVRCMAQRVYRLHQGSGHVLCATRLTAPGGPWAGLGDAAAALCRCCGLPGVAEEGAAAACACCAAACLAACCSCSLSSRAPCAPQQAWHGAGACVLRGIGRPQPVLVLAV